MDQVVRKTTELGLTRLTPLFTARSEVRPDQRRIEDRLERWRRVSRQAVKQCRRGRPVDVRLPSSGSDFFKQARADVKVVCQAGGSEKRPWADAFPAGRPESVVLLVGPEGGWAPDEVQSAREAGFLSLGLGPRVLRAETAALTAVVLALHRWGDIA
jgi:16S rRNA (uracil1498-N3)-methyltransferase